MGADPCRVRGFTLQKVLLTFRLDPGLTDPERWTQKKAAFFQDSWLGFIWHTFPRKIISDGTALAHWAGESDSTRSSCLTGGKSWPCNPL
jgi:hypothetical protein